MKKTNLVIKRAISTFSELEKEVCRLYFLNKKNANVDSIGKKLGVSKQRVSYIAASCVKKIVEIDEATKKHFDLLFKEKNEYQYFDSNIFGKYALLVGKICKTCYEYKNIGKGLYTTDPYFKYYVQKKHLSNIVKEKGLPIILGTISTGFMSKNMFAYLSTPDPSEWLVEDDVVYGNEKFTFCTNCCRYQIKEPTSLWDIYAFYHEYFPYYLKERDVFSPKDLGAFIQKRTKNLLGIESECSVILAVPMKDNIYSTPIYEISSVPVELKSIYSLLETLT